jgi:hypothetical protein
MGPLKARIRSAEETGILVLRSTISLEIAQFDLGTSYTFQSDFSVQKLKWSINARKESNMKKVTFVSAVLFSVAFSADALAQSSPPPPPPPPATKQSI